MSHVYEIEVFETESGRTPFIDWQSSLDNKAKATVAARIQRLKMGNLGDCKYLDDGVFELRIHLGPGFRIYFGMHGNKLVILLTGGDKKTQSRDIKKALEYWGQWESA